MGQEHARPKMDGYIHAHPFASRYLAEETEFRRRLKKHGEKASKQASPLTPNNQLSEPSHTIPTELQSPLKTSERVTYLLQFDSEHPQKLLCFACGAYHQRLPPQTTIVDRPCKKGFKPDKDFLKLVYSCEKANEAFTQTFTCNTMQFRWPTFYEVMRGFRLGQQYGTPYFFNQTGFFKAPVEDDTKAIAVADRLLLRHRISLAFSTTQLRFCRLRHLCPHMREIVTQQGFARDITTAAELAAYHFDDLAFFRGFIYKTYRCTSCPTEVVIEVVPSSLFTGYHNVHIRTERFVMSIVRYVDFGALRSPDEIEWRSLTTWYKRGEDDWEDLAICAKYEKLNVPRQDWPCIDLTHLEPISTRFEREVAVRPIIIDWQDAMHGQKEPPAYST